LLYGFGCLKASKDETSEKSESYKEYFAQQEKIYQGLVDLGIPGARPLDINEALAESVLANSPKEVNEIISDFEYNQFSTNKKNIIFHGPSGTGKSVLAQAIAIKTQTPCLFFDAGAISTTYMNSGVQNLNTIFEYAQKLEIVLGKPCIIIFDELETLTEKHVGTNNPEKNILRSFWQALDKLRNSKVIAIGTMNGIDDVPDQIINRTSMIEVPLSNLKQREAILSYHSKTRQDKHKLAYPEWLTATYLARRTKGFCNRDLESVIEEATRPVIKTPAPLNGSNKLVPADNFYREIKKVQWQFIEKWQRTFKKHLRDPKITLPLASIAVVLTVACYTISIQKESLANQKANHKESIALQIAHQKENVANQKEGMEQSQKIADRQMSDAQIATQAEINLSVLGIPVGVPYYHIKNWYHSKN
jgi:hypothetical protein